MDTAPNAVGSRWLGTIRTMGWAVVRPIQRRLVIRGPVDFQSDLHLGMGTRVESAHGLVIGRKVYVGRNCSITADGSIGNHVLIANSVGLLGKHDHDASVVGVGMTSAPWIGDDDYAGPGLDEKIDIEDDVWLGYGCIVLSGTTVGRGSIVAAGSVVTKDVAPYSIVAGNPARVVGERHPKDVRQQHEALLAPRLGELADGDHPGSP